MCFNTLKPVCPFTARNFTPKVVLSATQKETF